MVELKNEMSNAELQAAADALLKEAEEKEKAPEADSDNPVDPNNPFGF